MPDCQYSFEMDVTKLVEKVKQQNLLFYPTVMHILMQKFNTLNADVNLKDERVVACVLLHENGQHSILWTPWQDEFETFYHNYVQECFTYYQSSEVFPKGIPPDNVVYVSCIGIDKLSENDKKHPILYLAPLKTSGHKLFLPVSLYQSETPSSQQCALFLAHCQKLCDCF